MKTGRNILALCGARTANNRPKKYKHHTLCARETLALILLPILYFSYFVRDVTAQVTTRYDRFENRTTTTTAEHNLTTNKYSLHLTVAGYFFFRGRGAGHTIDSVGLIFKSKSDEWEFLKNARLIIIIDGRPEVFNQPTWKDDETPRRVGPYDDHRITETLVFQMKPSVIKRIANSKTVEARLGSVEFSFPTRFLQDLQTLISKVRWVDPPAKKSRGLKG